MLVKPADVPTYVEYGAADAGIAGRDVVMESRADLIQPLDLNFGHCKTRCRGARRRCAQRVREPDDPGRHEVSAYHDGILQRARHSRGNHSPVRVIELAPLIGLADRIVDLVESGRTLKENGLEIVEVIAGKLRAACGQPRRLSDEAE